MRPVLKYHIIILLLIYFGCTPKTVPVVSEEEDHHEDLSVYRPVVQPYVAPENNTRDKDVDREPSRQPSLDVTEELGVLLDSISKVNRKFEYYEYTVLVHIGNNRELADEARMNVIRVLPDVQPKLEYKSPSYRVKVGRYFNNVAAYQTYLKLKETFPNAIIVPEKVYFKED